MNEDTISRSALIADLENRKVTAGDPVIRFLFDRLIDIVKDQPSVSRQVEIKVTPSPSEGRVLEHFGLVWFPDLSDPDSLAATIDERIRGGWRPCKWVYGAETDTDYRCFSFLFEREL